MKMILNFKPLKFKPQGKLKKYYERNYSGRWIRNPSSPPYIGGK
jgi:hypothetical protein